MQNILLKKQIRAVIFDLDGTIIDSEPNYYLADRKFLETWGHSYTPEDHAKFKGVGSLNFIQQIKERHGIPDSVESLLAYKDELYRELALQNTPVFPEMARLIRTLSEQRLPLAVASGSSRELIELLLGQVGLRAPFQVVISAEEVPRGKPAPDVFLEAARRLGEEPAACLVLEDSRYGVEAALAAGMHCVAIQEESRPPDVFLKADLLFSRGMEEFRAAAVLDWIAAAEQAGTPEYGRD